MKRIFLLSILTLFCGTLFARNTLETDTLGLKVYFRQGYAKLEPSYRGNEMRLKQFSQGIHDLKKDSLRRIRTIRIEAFASPEGSYAMNQRLAEKRAQAIVDFIRRTTNLPDSLFDMAPQGINWKGLTEMVKNSDMPYRDEVLKILNETPEWIFKNNVIVDGRHRQLGMLHGGRAYRHMYKYFFPDLRNSESDISCIVERLEAPQPEIGMTEEPKAPEAAASPAVEEPETVSEAVTPTTPEKKPFYMALKTNLLYDAALIPNIGIEFYLKNGWSIEGNWMYAWWKNDNRHNYWRTYGGELGVRKYFGRRAETKPLTGHHLGLYGQMLTYDFELGGTGYQSKLSYGVGVEYGYSLPIGRRLNLDFGIGIGYLGGEYKKYDPIDEHYVWKQTRQRHWFGPTKAEISLVWLIGRGNYNAKGGK